MRFMNLRSIAALIITIASPFISPAQVSDSPVEEPRTKNIILVTLDGFRWQEFFRGAESHILTNEKYVSDPTKIGSFGKGSEIERRQALMPFIWSLLSSEGQLYGNRDHKNKVNCTNHHLLSYPGYSEMLVGFKHRKVSSNRKIENPHATVFEVIGQDHRFRNEVAAFATWDAFPYILRESKSDIYVNAGKDFALGNISRQEQWLK